MYGGLIAGRIGSVFGNGKGLLRISGIEWFNGGLKGSPFLFTCNRLVIHLNGIDAPKLADCWQIGLGWCTYLGRWCV